MNLLKYLERNKYPGVLGYTVDGTYGINLQTLIRGTEARGFVYKYPRLKFFARPFRRDTQETDWSFNLPLWPSLSDLLDQDTTLHIFFRFLTIGRLKRSQKSFGIIGLCNFVGMETFSARDSDLETDEVLAFLKWSQPRLAHVDLHGSKNIGVPCMTSIIAFLQMLAPRLKSLVLGCHGERFMDHDLSKSISNAPYPLESLTLTLNHNSRDEFDFSCFNGHEGLRALTLTLDGPVSALPNHLPNLERLKLEIVDQTAKQYWRLLGNCQSPKLKQLELTLSYAYPEMRLHADMLISILMKIPSLKSIIFRRVKRCSPPDESNDLKLVEIPEGMVHVLDENRREMKFEAQEVKRLHSFTSKRSIQCVVHNDS